MMIQMKYQTGRYCMIYAYICNLFSFLMCYHYRFAFHLNANGPFTYPEQHKFEASKFKRENTIVCYVLCFSEEIDMC